jgi:DNA polymerase-3 subunit gamma/tau
LYDALWKVKIVRFINMQEALYRKHRPATLEELVGQPDAVALISEQIKKNNLSHAYLFSGPRGVGKTSLARIIATYNRL